MRDLGLAIARGLGKGLGLGLCLGLVLTHALGWPMPAGSLLGYLASMAVAGSTGIAGGKAPWREGAWLVALLKAVAGVAAGAFLYWVLCVHVDAALPAEVVALLGIPGAAEDGSISWVAYAPLSLAAIAGVFGLFVELDHLAGDDEPAPRAKAAATAPKKSGAKVERAALENADTVAEPSPEAKVTRRER